MKITKHYSNDGKYINLVLLGNLDESTAYEAEKELTGVLSTEAEKITLDLNGVNYISSIGIRSLIVAHKKAIKYGKTITMENISPKAEEVLRVVGILSFFQAT